MYAHNELAIDTDVDNDLAQHLIMNVNQLSGPLNASVVRTAIKNNRSTYVVTISNDAVTTVYVVNTNPDNTISSSVAAFADFT